MRTPIEIANFVTIPNASLGIRDTVLPKPQTKANRKLK